MVKVDPETGKKGQEKKSTKKKKTPTLDDYTMKHEIGEGAFGLVKLAIDKKMNKMVAVKSVDMMKIIELSKERHIMREKSLLAELKHPNIIELYCTFKDTKNLYFVFEIGPNGTVDDLIKKMGRNMNEKIIQVMFAQMVNVIEFLQNKDIMHRDLKPQNLMLDENYNVKFIDFGDARKVNEQDDEEGSPQIEQARRGTFVGTVNY